MDKNEKMSAEKEHEGEGGIWQDPRFQHLVADPRFKSLPKYQRKVKIDKRFQSMFEDKKFNIKYTVDKYGRRVQQSTADDLRKYYELDSSASEEDNDEEAAAKQEMVMQREEEKAISRQTDDSESEDEKTPKTLREKLVDPKIDYARGEGYLFTDSSTGDETTEDENDQELEIDHVWGELDNDAQTTKESSRRLAVCNMDWDRIRATDLMVLFSSFLPPGGSVLNVKIYQSEFGKERMLEEERHGPQELISSTKGNVQSKDDNDSDGYDDNGLLQQQDSDVEDGDDYDMEKLRQYQLTRLRYYYAVIECDSIKTADKIYGECDGHEYESSATRLDLRYVPDETTFDEEPHDVCDVLPDNNTYMPRLFTNTALQQAQVDLTWDETALDRRELSEKLLASKLEDVNDADVRKIIAYSSEEDTSSNEETMEDKREGVDGDDDDDDDEIESKRSKVGTIAKYKALLAEINEQEQKEKCKKYDVEFSWEIDTKKDSKDNIDNKDIQNETKDVLTPIEKVLKKRSEKNKKRKDERKKKKREALGLNTDVNDTDSDSIPDGIDMNDPYFAEEFANGEFIDAKTKKKEKTKKSTMQLKETEEEKKHKEQELQLLLDDDDVEEHGKQHFSLEKIIKNENESKSKRKRKKQLKKSRSTLTKDANMFEDNFQMNLNDERFKAVYTSHHFNVDPTDSHYKKTRGMEKLIEEKLKRRYGSKTVEESPMTDDAAITKRSRKQLENTILAQSLKRKIEMTQNASKK